jgi:hypothetical protein
MIFLKFLKNNVKNYKWKSIPLLKKIIRRKQNQNEKPSLIKGFDGVFNSRKWYIILKNSSLIKPNSSTF